MKDSKNKIISTDVLERAMSYETYFNLINDLTAKGKTTGEDQSEKFIIFTKLNFQRMKRVFKTTLVNEGLKSAIKNLDKKMIWLVLTEGWCGDAAQNLPAMSKISEMSDHIELKILLRDENPDIMNAYLTNGGKSIPKLIALDAENLHELFVWGPRPEKFQSLVMEHKHNPKLPNEEFQLFLHKEYTLDKTQHLQLEMKKLIDGLN